MASKSEAMIAASGSYTLSDMASVMLTQEAWDAINVINEVVDFESFGKKSALTYQQDFIRLATAKNLPSEVTAIVIYLTVMIKNKERIMREIDTNMKLRQNPSAIHARKFISENLIQYVNPNDTSKFPIVKLPDSFPSMSALMYVRYNPKGTVAGLLSNTWFAGMYISDELQDLNEAATRKFWTVVVQKTRNKTTSRDNARKAGVFYTDIYENSINDEFRFLMNDTTIKNDRMLTFKHLLTWFNLIRNQNGRSLSNETYENVYSSVAMYHRASVDVPANEVFAGYDANGTRLSTFPVQESYAEGDFSYARMADTPTTTS
jgi:hypothetical protein